MCGWGWGRLQFQAGWLAQGVYSANLAKQMLPIEPVGNSLTSELTVQTAALRLLDRCSNGFWHESHRDHRMFLPHSTNPEICASIWPLSTGCMTV